MNPRRHGQLWTEAEDAQLRREIRKGIPISTIAARHERTSTAIAVRIADLTDGDYGSSADSRDAAILPESEEGHPLRARFARLRNPGVISSSAVTDGPPSAENDDRESQKSAQRIVTPRENVIDIWMSLSAKPESWDGIEAEIDVLSRHDSHTLEDAGRRLVRNYGRLTAADWVLECDWPGVERLRITSTELQAGGEEVRTTCVELLCAAMEKIDSKRECDILMWRIGLRGVSADSADTYDISGFDEEQVQMLVDQALDQLRIGAPDEVFRAWDHVHGVFRSALKTSLGALDPSLVLRLIQVAMPQVDLAVSAILVAHLCGHAHAIDVIYKQVKHLACQQQRRLEQQQKREQESQQRRARIGELADRINWPNQPTPIDRTACVPQRRTRGSARSVAGLWRSAKLRRYVNYESQAERNFIQFLEASDLVENYCEQPVEIEYVLYGRTRSYYPDFLVDLRDGRRFVVEVKASLGEFAKYINVVKLAAAREYCHHQGWGLLATDTLQAVADLITRTVPESSVTALREMLDGGVMSLASFKDFLNEYHLSWSDAAAVIYREGWCWRTEPFRLSIALRVVGLEVV